MDSTEIWRHLPLLFQRSCLTFGRTCTVIEQLKNSSNKKLTSLRLVGVEGTVNIGALGEALIHNTTLQQVSICGTFLQTLAVSPGNENGVLRLFQAIGSLPNLTQLTLQGNEDSEAFPVEALALLLETNNQLPEGGRLKEMFCRYVDLLCSNPSSTNRLGQALKSCNSLKKVQWVSLDILQPPTANNNTTGLLDPVISALSHCEEVEIGLRHRREDCDISPRAFQSLLSNHSGQLRKLTIKQRIPVDSLHLSAILQCLSKQSTLTELQLDEVILRGDTNPLWKTLAEMLTANSTLEILDLHFVSEAPSHMNHKAFQAMIIDSLRRNTSLKSLSLPGALDKLQYDAAAWIQLLEEDNFSLEELELFPAALSPSQDFDYQRKKLLFFLQLNRQSLMTRTEPQKCGRLRTILRDCDGAIPHHLVQPCVLAALHLGCSEEEITEDHQDHDDDDLYWDATHNTWTTTTTDTFGLSGLFYLLQQQPSLVLALQQKMMEAERRQRLLEKKRKAAESKAYIPLGGASPQLLLEDDTIVALW